MLCATHELFLLTAPTLRRQIFFHLYEICNRSSLETRQAMISPSLAFFLLPVLHFKLIQTDFPPSSVSNSSFASLPQRFHLCYLHPTIHPSLHLQPSAFYSMQLSRLKRSFPICQPTFQNFCLSFPLEHLKTRTSQNVLIKKKKKRN